MFKIRKACNSDVDTVLNHYRNVVDQISDNKFNPQWKYGVYPTDEYIINQIDNGDLYVGIIDEVIVSSIVINDVANNGYDAIQWNVDASICEVYYIHLVAVNQKYKNRGIAKAMLRYAFRLALNNGIKVIRLSLHSNNLIIEKLYTQLGFVFVTSIRAMDARGLTSFNVYEKVL